MSYSEMLKALETVAADRRAGMLFDATYDVVDAAIAKAKGGYQMSAVIADIIDAECSRLKDDIARADMQLARTPDDSITAEFRQKKLDRLNLIRDERQELYL